MGHEFDVEILPRTVASLPRACPEWSAKADWPHRNPPRYIAEEGRRNPFDVEDAAASMPRVVTLRQIAALVGCTRSTVSLALRNHPHVAAETRERVHAIARGLGWTPNAGLAHQMSLVRGTGSSRAAPNLAILVNLSKDGLAAESTPSLHLQGAISRAKSLGYGVNVINLGEQPLAVSRLRQVLKARGVKALVFVATASRPFPNEYLELGESCSTALVGWRCGPICYHAAYGNQLANAQLAVAHVRARGFQRPSAVIPDALDRFLMRGFSSGIVAGQHDLPQDRRVPPLILGSEQVYVPETEYEKVRAWVAEHRPDGLFTTDVRSLVRCLHGWSPRFALPTLFSLDYHPGDPVAGGVDERSNAVGAAGVDLAVAQFSRGEIGMPAVPYTLHVEGHWVDVAGVIPAARNRRSPSRHHGAVTGNRSRRS